MTKMTMMVQSSSLLFDVFFISEALGLEYFWTCFATYTQHTLKKKAFNISCYYHLAFQYCCFRVAFCEGNPVCALFPTTAVSTDTLCSSTIFHICCQSNSSWKPEFPVCVLTASTILANFLLKLWGSLLYFITPLSASENAITEQHLLVSNIMFPLWYVLSVCIV